MEVIEALRNFMKEREVSSENLSSGSRPLHELVVSVNFIVHDVVAQTHGTSFTPTSEWMIGGSSPVYWGGFTSSIILKVSPDDRDIPVRELTFDGFSPIRAGDYISAKIPRYEEKKFSENLHSKGKTLYFDRDFKEEERAIELAIISDGRVVRTDRAVDYRS
ncbi:hypothetical protein HY450_03025 [Candidatus Pacearchaeota archaeon]|nr:hypothetical protein [Candidatus Pacearchaeota archaeon]